MGAAALRARRSCRQAARVADPWPLRADDPAAAAGVVRLCDPGDRRPAPDQRLPDPWSDRFDRVRGLALAAPRRAGRRRRLAPLLGVVVGPAADGERRLYA